MTHLKQPLAIVLLLLSMTSFSAMAAEDYGDAPVSFGDASHTVNGGATIFMGNAVPDTEAGSTYNGVAIGDDGGDCCNDDEDSVPRIDGTAPGSDYWKPNLFPLLLDTATTYSIPIEANNSSGAAVNMRGWIDFDHSGTFDDDEASDLISVANGAVKTTPTNLVWSSVPGDIAKDTTYIRIRISSDAIGVSDDIGLLSDGEVEDHVIGIAFAPIPDTLDVEAFDAPDACQAVVFYEDFNELTVNITDYWAPNSVGTPTIDIPGWDEIGGGEDTYANINSNDLDPTVYDANGNVIPSGTDSDSIYFGNGQLRRVSPLIGSGFSSDAIGNITNNIAGIELRTEVDDMIAGTSGAGNFGTSNGQGGNWGEPVTLSRTFATVPGVAYQVNWWVRAEGASDGLAVVEVPGGAAHFTIFGPSDTDTQYTIKFTATSTTSTLAFTNYGHFSNTFCKATESVSCTLEGSDPGTAEIILDDIGVYEESCSDTADLAITKDDGITAADPGDTLTYTVNISNNGPDDSGTGIEFTDTLPTGITVNGGAALDPYLLGGTDAANWDCEADAASPQVISCVWNAGGTGLIASTSNSIAITTDPVPAGSAGTTLTNSVEVTPDPAVTDGVPGNDTGTHDTPVNIPALAPTLTKTISPSPIIAGGTSTMTLVITNPNAIALTGLSLTDSYPAGMTNGAGGLISNSCGGTVTSTSGTNSAVLAGGTVAASGSCTIEVEITSSTVGTVNNTTGPVGSNEAPDSAPASDDLVVDPAPVAPTLTKTIAPSPIIAGGTSTMTLVISNTNGFALTGLSLTDTYPAGMTNGAGGLISNTCAGAVTSTSGTTSAVLTGGTVAANGSCTIEVEITSSTVGSVTNTTGPLGSNEAPDGAAASDDLVVDPAPVAPTLTKTISPSPIFAGGTSTMTLVISNSNAIALTGLSLTDTYPAGMTNGAGGLISNGCGGTVTSASGSNSAVLAAGTVAANGSCTIEVEITSSTVGSVTNTTGAVGSNEAPDSAPASDDLVVDPAPVAPTLTKTISPSPIIAGGTSTMTLVITNSNAIALTGLSLTDNYPAGITNVQAVSNSCGGTLTSTSGATSAVLAGGTLAANASCTMEVEITSSTVGTVNNTTGPVGSNEAPDGAPASDDLVVDPVPGAPTLTKTISPSPIAVGGVSTLTLVITNPNAFALSNVGLTDTYPAAITNSAAATQTNSCGGTVTAAANGPSAILAGGAIAANGNCTITVEITSSTVGTHTNTTGVVSSTEAPDSTTATDDLVVTSVAPTLTKTIAPSPIVAGGTSTMTLVISNSNAIALTGLSLTDTYPAGMTNGPGGLISNGCGGTVTSASGSNSAVLAAGTVAANGSCTIEVEITSSTVGSVTNTTGAVGSNEAPDSAPASDDLVVDPVPGAPTLTKTISPSPIAVGGVSTLTLVITNPNTFALSNVALTDTYPAGLILNSAAATQTNTCNGTLTAAAGGGSAVLAGGSIAANASCTMTVEITSNTAGTHTNLTGVVSSTEAPDSNTATDDLVVTAAAPTLTKTISPSPIIAGGTSTMTLVITNPNAIALTGVSLTDNYPTGITNDAGVISNSCAGTLTAATGTTSAALSAGTIAANGSCTMEVEITSSTVGSVTNTTGVVGSNEAPDSATASDDLVVDPAPVAPTLSKTIAPSPIVVGGTSTMTLVITNPNAFALSGVSLTDTYPAGMTNGPGGLISNSCAGTVTSASGTNSAVLAGGAIATSSSCTIEIEITSSTVGSVTNTTGPVGSNEAPDGAPANDDLVVGSAGAPLLSKNFNPTVIPVGGTSTMTLVITNTTATPLTGVGLLDAYPIEITNATPDNEATTCGGTLTSLDGGTDIELSGGTIAGNGSCTITVVVTSSMVGTHTNETDPVTSNEAADSEIATDDLTVAAAPTIAKVFSPDTISSGGASTLTITLTNPNAVAANLDAPLVDNLPANVTVATPSNIGGTCVGTKTSTAASVMLGADGVIPASSSCTLVIDVTSSTIGTWTNTIPTGALETDLGDNPAPATDDLVVTGSPSIAKSFSPATFPIGGTSTLTITLTNPNASVATLNTALVDNLPGTGRVLVASPAVIGGTCTGSVTAVAGSASVAYDAGGTIPAASSCTVTVLVTSNFEGTYTNTIPTGALDTDLGSNPAPATDDLVVTAEDPTLTKVFSPDVIPAGGTSTLTITLGNPNNIVLTDATVSDNYPAQITNASPANGMTTCSGGTLLASSGGANVVLFGSTLPANGSCTITVVVTSSTAGSWVNTTSVLDVNETMDSNTASDTLTVMAAPNLVKSFAANSISAGDTTTMTLSIGNPNAVALTGVALSDTYPGQITNATPDNEATTCGAGTITSTDGGSSISLTGGTIAANSTCTITVDVTSSTVGGPFTNTTGVVTSNEAPDSTTASDDLSVTEAGAPTLTKTIAPSPIAVGGTSTMTLVIANPNGFALSNVALTDNYPTGMQNGIGVISNGCNGTLTAAANGSSAVLAGGSIAANSSCTMQIGITSNAAGTYTNITGVVSSDEAADSATATDDLVVTSVAPSLTKTISPSPITVGGTSTMTLVITNSNAIALSNVALSDTYPAGMLTGAGSVISNSCNGTLTAAAGGNSAVLAGGSIAANGSCTMEVEVTSNTAGNYTNVTGVVSSNEAADSTTATDDLVVDPAAGAPTLTKTIAPSPIVAGGTSTLTLEITNPNAFALSNVGLTDNYPVGMENGIGVLSNGCNGTLTAAANGTSAVLAGGSIAANGSCTMQIGITSNAAGTYNNVTGVVTSDEAPDSATATDDLVVTPAAESADLSVTKDDAVTAAAVGDALTYTLTITNAGPDASGTGVTLFDSLPANMTVNNGAAATVTLSGANASDWSCASDAAIPQGISCSYVAAAPGIAANGNSVISFVTDQLPASVSGTNLTNSVTVNPAPAVTDPDLTNNDDQHSVAVGNVADLTISKDDGITMAAVGDVLTYTLTVDNNGPDASGTGLSVTDTMPAGLTVNGGAAGAVITGGLNAADWTCSSDAASPQVISCSYVGLAPGVANAASSSFSFMTDMIQTASNGMVLTNSASVNPDPAVVDSNTANNNATHDTPVDALAALTGTVWLDASGDDMIDPQETLLAGWTVNVLDANGNVILDANGNPATAITDGNGFYSIPDLPPGTYTVEFVSPNGVTFAEEGVTLPVNVTVDVPLPIDPSGVVYDAITRQPVPGAIVTFIDDSTGLPVPPQCLLPGQQNQVTAADGYYRFDIAFDDPLGSNPGCPTTGGTYSIAVQPPTGYTWVSDIILPQPGQLDATICPIDSIPGVICEVQPQDTAPQIGDSTIYYLSFELFPGDQDVINNHIPLDPPPANILLSKSANKSEVLIGDLVQYTLEATNDSAIVGIANAQVVDNLPAGFAYMVNTAVAYQAGLDGIFGTGDDVSSSLISMGTDPVTFSSLNFAPNETILIRYLVSVGTGVSSDGGNYINVAQITDPFGNALSNTATAAVQVTKDPMLEETTILGKVWHDRDADGFQDNANATGLKVGSDYFGWNSLDVGDLPGRIRETDPVSEHQTVVRMPYNRMGDNSFRVSTKEGTVINVDNDGNISTDHRGKKEHGMTAQDIRVEVSKGSGKPTVRGNQIIAPAAAGTEVINITITNHGIHEEGIPGVRLATVEGLLIETDQFGRYHVAGVDTGHFSTGTNYIIKVDDATLPEGAVFTTENPRVQRLTQALMTRFNFGVDLPDMIVPAAVAACDQQYEMVSEGGTRVEPRSLGGLIDPVRFASGKSQIPAGYAAQLEGLINSHSDKQNLRVRFVGHTDNERLSPSTAAKYGSNQGLSEARARMVADVVMQGLSIDSSAILTDGFADTQPLASNDTREGMALNRRVEIELVYDEIIDDSRQVRVPVGPACDQSTPQQIVSETVTDYVTQSLGNAVEPVRFASGRSQIPADYIERLRSVINSVSDKQNLRIRFKGHTDNERLAPSTQAKYGTNQGLSEARARQVADVIAQGLGMPDLPVSIEGYADTQPIASNSTQDGMALNRRVEVEVLYDEAVNRVVNRQPAPMAPVAQSITLPHGGVIWATEDPGKVDPRLDIMADGPLIVDGGSKIAPINFTVYSNYQSYIESYQISLYHEDDTDLARPLSKLVGKTLRFDQPISWDGYLQNAGRPEAGEHLVYVLEVSDSGGRTDRTAPQLLRVIDADINRHEDDSNADRTYGGSILAQQNIPIYGSRVRLHGQDLDRNYTLMINDQQVQIGEDNNFVYEQQMPMGDHRFDVKVSNKDGQTWDRSVDVTVDGDYLFIVALANLTIGENDTSGNLAPLNGDHHFDGSEWVDGRIAAYMKGKVRGKYLVTAQIDTTEDDIDNLGDNLERTDGNSVFRRLDADQYYATYGDDSTTISDVDTQGAFYLRVDWDNNKALWGNYNTQITGTEFAQYNRSLYGAQFVHESLKTNDYGDNRSAVYAFASEAQTASAHNEYLATGGSLYYLRETDIVRGSEKVWVEVRSRDSQRVIDLIPMEEGRDYQIDYLQGRIILNRPLTQVANQSAPSIIRDQALEGDDVILAVDYEYQPQGFTGDDVTAGVRGKGWLGNMIGVGGTYITEERTNAADYTLSGIDVTLKAGKGTWVKAEYAESESAQSSSWLSRNGGLSFNSVSAANSGMNTGEAISVEGQIHLGELMDSDMNAKLNAWYKDRDAGFSSTRTNDGIETNDIGIEGSYQNDLFSLTARANQLEQGTATTRTANLQAQVGVSDHWSVIGELRYEDADQSDNNLGFTSNGDALLGALGLKYQFNDHTELWGSLQTVLEDSGSYRNNDAFILGARSQMSEHLAMMAEVSSGDRGDALNLGIDWSVNDNINVQLEGGFGDVARSQVGTTFTTAGGLELYGSYAVDTDRTDNEQQRLTFGQAQRYGDGSRLYAEQQFTNDKVESGITHIFGVDHRLTDQMGISASLQSSSLETGAGDIERTAGSIGADYKDGNRLKASARLEYREDTGIENTTQWLTTNALDWQQNDHLRWVMRLNLSVTENDSTGIDDGQFVEADIGFAYRPVSNDRLNILGKYTYLYDLPARLSTGSLVGQNDSSTDQRMHVLSIEALYDLSRKWEIGAKIATRQSQTRALRGSGAWYDSGATLAAVRARYHMIHNWDALAEYHILMSEAGDDQRQGALVALYRHIGKHFKVGIGYNFTDFSDDLTNTGYDANGVFLDLTGKY